MSLNPRDLLIVDHQNKPTEVLVTFDGREVNNLKMTLRPPGFTHGLSIFADKTGFQMGCTPYENATAVEVTTKYPYLMIQLLHGERSAGENLYPLSSVISIHINIDQEELERWKKRD